MRCVLAALACGLTAGAIAAQVPDRRSVEVVRLDCVTGGARSDVTLFGNGTLRLWEGEVGSETMTLSELDPDGLEAYLRRLRQESLGDGLVPPRAITGQWVESCRLTLDVPDGPSGSVTFGGLDSLSLALSRVVGIARELMALSRTRVSVTGLDADYEPRIGDVLVDREGDHYRINSFTGDGTGVELVGVEQPLTIYLAVDSLQERFLAVADRPW